MASHILLVEDDFSLGETLKERLTREGYSVEWKLNCKSALDSLQQSPFDLLILDVTLPDGNGFDLARQVLKLGNRTPFLFMTALNGAEARLEGYEIGAAEFIPKPFHLKELLLRVKHVLDNHLSETLSGISLGGVTIDFISRLVTKENGRSEPLPGREFQLLKILIERSPEILSRDEILNHLVGEDQFPSHRTVDNAVVRIRQILGKEAAKALRSVRGVGYQWLASNKEME